jgi:small subunit ribosomal protein S11
MERLANVVVNCSSNNTIIHTTLSNNKNIILSTGLVGFKGAKRSSSHAAQKVAELLGSKLLETKVVNIIITFKGLGKGRKFILKGLKKSKINVLRLIDRTPLPHNGCRPKKRRRK